MSVITSNGKHVDIRFRSNKLRTSGNLAAFTSDVVTILSTPSEGPYFFVTLVTKATSASRSVTLLFFCCVLDGSRVAQSV
jgi:hypothetical protein